MSSVPPTHIHHELHQQTRVHLRLALFSSLTFFFAWLILVVVFCQQNAELSRLGQWARDAEAVLSKIRLVPVVDDQGILQGKVQPLDSTAGSPVKGL